MMAFGRGGTAVKERDPLARLNGAKGMLPSARSSLPTKRRSRGYVALGVVLVVGLGALGGFAYTSAGAKVPVVVVVREVPAGHLVSRDDVSTVDVAGAVVAVGGDRIDSVLGQTATVDLLPDTLLQRSMLTAGPLLSADQAQVGVAVSGGQIPADGLQPGDTVQVLQLPGKDAVKAPGAADTAGDRAVALVAKASVFAARADPSSASGTLVTLLVPAAAAPDIATASSRGLVALVKVAR